MKLPLLNECNKSTDLMKNQEYHEVLELEIIIYPVNIESHR